MVRKLFTIVVAFMLCCLVGCVSPEEVDDGKLRGGNLGKPDIHTLAFQYVIEKKEFNIGEDVEIEFSFGTQMFKHNLDYGYNRSDVNEAYRAVMYYVNNEEYFTFDEKREIYKLTYEYPTAVILKEIDDFCAENYPYPIDGEFLYSYKTTFPHDLFTGEYGEIFLGFKDVHYLCSQNLYYKTEDNKALLSNKRH